MRFLGVFFVLFSFHVHADICGLYQMEDYGDRVVYSLVNLNPMTRETMNYTITNTGASVVKTMLNGLCYCVRGEDKLDPAYESDPQYMVLEITHLVSGPFTGCMPN